MIEGYTEIDSLTITSKLQNLPNVEALVDKVCGEIGVSEDMYGNVLIAVTEAVNNAIIHGNSMKAEAEVAVSVVDSESTFGFSVKDSGNGFDHINLPDPTAPENIEKESGRGIFLMRNLADDVQYNESGNTVTVLFNK